MSCGRAIDALVHENPVVGAIDRAVQDSAVLPNLDVLDLRERAKSTRASRIAVGATSTHIALAAFGRMSATGFAKGNPEPHARTTLVGEDTQDAGVGSEEHGAVVSTPITARPGERRAQTSRGTADRCG